MSKSIKKSIKLQDGEACVVASNAVWQDLIAMFYETANICGDAELANDWKALANHFENWVDLTLYSAENNDV